MSVIRSLARRVLDRVASRTLHTNWGRSHARRAVREAFGIEPSGPVAIADDRDCRVVISDGPGRTAADGFAVPPRELWRGYGETEERYLQLGQGHAARLVEIAGEAGFAFGAGRRVLDFGCGAGPVLRAQAPRAGGAELWGCDIDAACIDWCRRHLPFRFFTNSTAPHLPVEDRSFDLVHAGSVFTHVALQADAWLLELARVLRPGGLLYATIHDRAFVEAAIREAPEWSFTRRMREAVGDAVWRGPWTEVRIGHGPEACVFHERAWFISMAAPALEPVRAVERAYGQQTAMVLRKPAL